MRFASEPSDAYAGFKYLLRPVWFDRSAEGPVLFARSIGSVGEPSRRGSHSRPPVKTNGRTPDANAVRVDANAVRDIGHFCKSKKCEVILVFR